MARERRAHALCGPSASGMAGKGAEWVMIALGILSALLLVSYGLVAVSDLGGSGWLFWLFVVLFLGYIGWDIWRHVRSLRSRARIVEDQRP